MSDTKGAAGSASEGIDLSQFFQVFFEEASENLERMEQLLLEIDIESADDEELNAVFRCAHSVKGGAATFGFSDLAELTHQMETLLDQLRRHELAPSAAMVDVLLKSGDALKAQLARHQAGGTGEIVDTSELLAQIRAMSKGQALAAAPASVTKPAQAAPTAADPVAAAPVAAGLAAAASTGQASGQRALELRVGPLESPALADKLVALFSEIADLGTIEQLDSGQAADGRRRFKIVTARSDDDLIDLFTFHVARERLALMPLGTDHGIAKGAPVTPPVEPVDDSYGLFDGAPGAPDSRAEATPKTPAAAPAGAAPTAAKATPAKSASTSNEAATLRVSVEKVDQLINLVGELVITQAMLAQNSAKLDPAQYQQLAKSLADLDRNTRDLQESVMSIRMIPMSSVYSRFPRMLRDLAAKLGNKVDFVTHGEATELDKGMIEKLTDPLTHLLRNSCDHGIEMPAERIAKGKPETGTLTLSASHQGGSIVIEVRDDGKGLSRTKLLAKARQRGIDAPDTMTDSEVWNLIFAPGFSTAEVVTDVSGRGVGMDVVKKNITALGGTVEIDSAEGHGMSVKVRLPLTLAIMDGMSVGVGGECYILPLASVVESFQPEPERLKSVGGSGQLVRVREDYLPVIELENLFAVPRRTPRSARPVMVVVEDEGVRVAMVVDELLGQQQVVVKNLETNYRRVEHVAGATIMGDGRVALILDTGSLVRRARH